MKKVSKQAILLVGAALACSLALFGCSQAEQPQSETADPTTAPAEQTTPADQADNTATDVKVDDEQPAGPVTFTDDMGNEVTVDNPQRVVACMGSFANAWELAGGKLVGVSDDALTSDGFTIQSADVATVGDFTNVNLESIVALEPDFVIMTSGTGGRGGDSSQADLREALVASGIPVAYFEVTTFEDYLRMMRTFADITGDEAAYEQNASSLEEAVKKIVGEVPADQDVTALVMTTFSGGTRVQNSGTMTGAMLADLGVRNLADENPSLLKDFSLESVIEFNPDYIFVIPMGNDVEAATANLNEATAANPAWSTLSAVQNGNYIVLDPMLFLSKPNAHWDDAYQTLFDELYN